MTGESVPSEKEASQIHEYPKTALGDRLNLGFMSTMVTRGRGVGVVVETGMDTEIGKIASIINTEVQSKTPLEIRLDKLGKTLGLIAVVICVAIFIIAMLQGRDLPEMFLMSVSLAVAAIPEGLVAIVAVVLAVGVTNLSKHHAIIKKLTAVETLGSLNVICSDKTGTLRQNKMTVTQCFTLDGLVELGSDKPASEELTLLAKAMILASDATYENDIGTGDPTEIALLLLGDQLGLDRKSLQESTQVLVGGKPIPLTEAHKKDVHDAVIHMSDQALRTLGAAYKPVSERVDPAEMENGLILIGMVGMIDPPRPEVKESILKAKEAGVATLMITGDHKNTAFAIAFQLGIAERMEQTITGEEIDELTDQEFAKRMGTYTVFARVSPEHKVTIVMALKAKGNIVSMTGDGVNDAPSLNAADIGVAMDITGTDVAKGASDMILTDDNFSTIVSAIEQGRNIYNNIRKSVIFLITCNLGEVLTIVVALLIGWPAPLLAMSNESFFAHGAALHVLLGGVLIGALTLFAFYFGYAEHGYSPFDEQVPQATIDYAHTMAFMVLVVCQLLYSLALRSERKSVFSIGLFSNKTLFGAILAGFALQFIVIAIPALRSAFHLQMPDVTAWAMIFALGLTPLILNELMKLGIRVRQGNAI